MDGPAWLFVTAICWLMSMVFGWTSVMQLKAVADDGRSSGLRTPFMTFLAACLMASSPSFLESLAVTTYGSDVWGKEVLSYVVDKDGSNKAFGAVLSMVSFIGYCFFVRGIWILKEAGEPQRPHGAAVRQDHDHQRQQRPQNRVAGLHHKAVVQALGIPGHAKEVVGNA